MRPSILPALIVVVGVLLLADFLVVNESLAELADLAIQGAILVAAGVALAAVVSLALRRGGDLWRRRGDPVGAVLVLAGMSAVLAAGLRPGAAGAGDPAVGWILAALVVPIGATLFGLLCVSTVGAARRSVAERRLDAIRIVGVASVTLVLLVPLGGTVGAWLAEASSWTLAVPVAAVFRGFLIGIALITAVVAARTMLGVGSTDE